MDIDIHGHPRKSVDYGYGCGCEISYQRQAANLIWGS